ncbi:MAG TPA: phosphate ABC transporter ATP-binding protein [Herpetosiphonaceae bacterium]
MTLLEVRDLSYATPAGAPLLANVSFAVPERSIATILGPSGSGKSTLLRSLNRLIEPPPGAIWLKGRDITALPPVELRREVGMVFQQAALFEGTVADNLRYGPGLRRAELADDRLRELLGQVGLPAELLERDAAALSGGQAQRVAFARALANEPVLLLLDEPTSALDPAATLTIEQLVRSLRDTLGLTFIWVTHNIEQTRRVSDLTLLLVDGLAVEWGDTAHLLAGDTHHDVIRRFAAGEAVSPAMRTPPHEH